MYLFLTKGGSLENPFIGEDMSITSFTTYHACLKPTTDSDRHFMDVQIIAQAVGPASLLFISNPFRHFLQAWLFAVHQDADAERTSCHQGTPKGMRTIMTMGEVRGKMEAQKASGPLVLSALYMAA